MKDDSGSSAVLTEHGSSASQVTAAKVMDVTASLPGSAGQAADVVSADTQVQMEDAPKLLKIPKSECQDVWICPPRHKWPKSWPNIEDPLERNLYGHPTCQIIVGARVHGLAGSTCLQQQMRAPNFSALGGQEERNCQDKKKHVDARSNTVLVDARGRTTEGARRCALRSIRTFQPASWVCRQLCLQLPFLQRRTGPPPETCSYDHHGRLAMPAPMWHAGMDWAISALKRSLPLVRQADGTWNNLFRDFAGIGGRTRSTVGTQWEIAHDDQATAARGACACGTLGMHGRKGDARTSQVTCSMDLLACEAQPRPWRVQGMALERWPVKGSPRNASEDLSSLPRRPREKRTAWRSLVPVNEKRRTTHRAPPTLSLIETSCRTPHMQREDQRR